MQTDRTFLFEGIWYVTVICAICGNKDEQVPWAAAKTPYNAAQQAEARHEQCRLQTKKDCRKQQAREEIELARREVERADRLFEKAKKDLEAAEAADKADKQYGRRLNMARDEFKRYEDSPRNARESLVYIESCNKE